MRDFIIRQWDRLSNGQKTAVILITAYFILIYGSYYILGYLFKTI